MAEDLYQAPSEFDRPVAGLNETLLFRTRFIAIVATAFGFVVRKEIETAAKKNALATVSLLPCLLLVCYMSLLLYFRAKGGYRAEELISEPEEVLLSMARGAEGSDEY